jgi:hypothetical protein
MIKLLTKPAAVFLIVLFASLMASAQANYTLPHAFNLNGIISRTLQPKFGRGMYNKLSPEGFYPIGWSRDGKFAYYVEPVDEACGCYFAELVIQDTRTDKELWHFKHDTEKHVDAEGAPIPDDIRKLWKRNEKMFVEKLREHGIQQTPRFALLPATFRVGAKTYTAKLDAVKANDTDGNRRVRKLDLQLLTPTLGKKSLYSQEYKGDDLWVSPLDSIVAGVFKSPYENRGAVVVLNVQRGWEGPPHSVNAQIIGADLMLGFRK